MFTTLKELFEPTIMVFGLTNSSAMFSMMMNEILQYLINTRKVVSFINNIIVRIEKKEELVEEVVKKLAENDLYVKLEKCKYQSCEQWTLFYFLILFLFLISFLFYFIFNLELKFSIMLYITVTKCHMVSHISHGHKVTWSHITINIVKTSKRNNIIIIYLTYVDLKNNIWFFRVG